MAFNNKTKGSSKSSNKDGCVLISAGDPSLFQSIILWNNANKSLSVNSSISNILTGGIYLTVNGCNIWSIQDKSLLPVLNYLLDNWHKLYSLSTEEDNKRYIESDSGESFDSEDKRMALHLSFGHKFEKRPSGVGDVYITLVSEDIFRVVAKRPPRLASWSSSVGYSEMDGDNASSSFGLLLQAVNANNAKYSDRNLGKYNIETHMAHTPAKVLLPALSSILKSCYFRLKKYGTSKYLVSNPDITTLMERINNTVLIEENV